MTDEMLRNMSRVTWDVRRRLPSPHCKDVTKADSGPKKRGNILEEQPYSTGRHLAVDSKQDIILSAGIDLLTDNIYKERLTDPYTLT